MGHSEVKAFCVFVALIVACSLLPYFRWWSLSLVNCKCFYQNEHLLAYGKTNARLISVGAGGCSFWPEFGTPMTSWRKSDIAVCATDCLPNCPLPVSAQIHHHLPTIRVIMICHLEMDGACCVVDGSCPGQDCYSSFHLVITHRHSEVDRLFNLQHLR